MGFWDIITDGIESGKSLDEISNAISLVLSAEIYRAIASEIDKVIQARNLTDDEQRIYDEWLMSEAEDTGEKLF